MARARTVLHVTFEFTIGHAPLRARLGVAGHLVPRRALNGLMSRRMFPDTSLRRLVRAGDLRYRPHILTGRGLGATAADALPPADVWLFSLINHEDQLMADPVFFDRVRARAAASGITLRNLSTHLDDGRLDLPDTPPDWPRIAKLRGNGAVGDYNPGSYAMLDGREALEAWRASVPDPDAFVLQPFLRDRRSRDGFHLIERWMCIGGDLTVGLRQSPDPVVKQANSVTHYLRDARELAAGEFDARRQWLQAREVRKGFLPLSVGYTDDPDFWDKRRATLADLTARTGFDLGTMDVLELEDGQLLVLDYNERTAESAWPDLEAIWDAALARYLGSC